MKYPESEGENLTNLPTSLVSFREPLEVGISRYLSARRVRRRRAAWLAIGGAAGTTAAIAAILISSFGPPLRVPPAAAAVITRAKSVLQQAPGTILHLGITVDAVDSAQKQSSVSWTRESWLLQRPPYTCSPANCPTIAYRQIFHNPAGGVFESSTTANGTTDLYNASTNTIYTGPPGEPNVQPQMLNPAELASAVNPLSLAFAPEIRALLSSPRAHIVGRSMVDGESTIEIDGAGDFGSWTYYVNPNGYIPVEFDVNAGTESTKIRFDAYEDLSSQGNMSLFNLFALHGGATVDSSTHDYEAQETRLQQAEAGQPSG